jgi:hypothetical protein
VLAGAGLAGELLKLGAETVQPVAAAGAYDATTFGARGDATTLDTPAINKAIEAAATRGGGTVHIPAGAYLCYSIHLKSNVTLYLGRGATIIAADPPASGRSGYDPAEPNQWDRYQDYGHSHWHNSLIWGEGLEHIAVAGPGRIWGKGLSRSSSQVPREGDPGVADKSISLKNCQDVTLRDFSILHGGHFGILATGVDNLTLDNLKIDTNRDGINIDCCKSVRISNCSVNSLSGIPGHEIEDISLSNMRIVYQGGGTQLDAALELPEEENAYPEPIMFGTTPAYGFFLRHVKGIAMRNIDIRCQQADLRPAFVLNDVKGGEFLHIVAQSAPNVPIFKLVKVEDIGIDQSWPLPSVHLERVDEESL